MSVSSVLSVPSRFFAAHAASSSGPSGRQGGVDADDRRIVERTHQIADDRLRPLPSPPLSSQLYLRYLRWINEEDLLASAMVEVVLGEDNVAVIEEAPPAATPPRLSDREVQVRESVPQPPWFRPVAVPFSRNSKIASCLDFLRSYRDRMPGSAQRDYNHAYYWFEFYETQSREKRKRHTEFCEKITQVAAKNWVNPEDPSVKREMARLDRVAIQDGLKAKKWRLGCEILIGQVLAGGPPLKFANRSDRERYNGYLRHLCNAKRCEWELDRLRQEEKTESQQETLQTQAQWHKSAAAGLKAAWERQRRN